MSLKGELTDLSLAELIEFFCNQRKTGRLTVSYPHTHAYFYLQSGAVVHASIGSLRGIEAVYYALTQSNASFNFSTAYEPPDHTINQPWTSVVLEGLRRMDEGIEPRDPFSNEGEPASEPTAVMFEAAAVPLNSPSAEVPSEPESPAHIDPTPIIQTQPAAPVQLVEQPKIIQSSVKPEPSRKHEASIKPKSEVVIAKSIKSVSPSTEPVVSDAFLSSAHNASRFSTAPWKFGVVFAAIVLIVAGIAVPWGWRARGKAKAAEQPAQQNEPAAQTQTPVSTETAQTGSDDASAGQSPDGTNAAPATADPADAARREREARAREEARLKAKAAAEANGTSPATPNSTTQSPAPATQSAATGPKKATVTVTYDENGRVTGASGSDPTALRIARQKRFPAGKAGSATLTIPIN